MTHFKLFILSKEYCRKLLKRSIALFLALIALISVVSVTALAAELDPIWRTEFRRFKMLSQGSPHTGYVYALQQFLWAYPSTKSYIVNAGGVDGSFGTGTGNAVRVFQTNAKKDWLPSMAVDGIAGGDTWASVAYYLSRSGSLFHYNGTSVMWYADNQLKYYKENVRGDVFHTIDGTVPVY